MSYDLSEIGKYFAYRETISLDDVTGALMGWLTGAVMVRTAENEPSQKVTLSDVTLIKEFEANKKRWEKNLQTLINAGAVKVGPEKWSSLATDQGWYLVELAKSFNNKFTDDFFLFGRVRYAKDAIVSVSGNAKSDALAFRVDDESNVAFKRLKTLYDPQSKWAAWDRETVRIEDVANVYLMNAVEGAVEKVEDAAPQETSNESSTADEPALPLGFKSLGTPPSTDSLPSMTGFEAEEFGAGSCLWSSPCYLLADRDLRVGEQVHVWAVDPVQGRLLKTVSLTATDANKGKCDWPKALVEAIQADRTLIDGSVMLQAGHLTDEAEFTAAEQSTTSTAFAACDEWQKWDVDRLWAFDSHCRLFSNAPFVANQVCAVVLTDIELPDGDRVCIQVRHRVTQQLYESHIFDPATVPDSAGWAKRLCEYVNLNSKMLRAGKRLADGITIEPADRDNALWIPQLSDLSVQVESVGWVKHETCIVDRALTAGERVWITVHDDITGAPLPGSPFIFNPTAAALEKEKWLTALTEELAASELCGYLALRKDMPADKTTLWKAGAPLCILMSEPLQKLSEPDISNNAPPEKKSASNEPFQPPSILIATTLIQIIPAWIENFLSELPCNPSLLETDPCLAKTIKQQYEDRYFPAPAYPLLLKLAHECYSEHNNSIPIKYYWRTHSKEFTQNYIDTASQSTILEILSFINPPENCHEFTAVAPLSRTNRTTISCLSSQAPTSVLIEDSATGLYFTLRAITRKSGAKLVTTANTPNGFKILFPPSEWPQHGTNHTEILTGVVDPTGIWRNGKKCEIYYRSSTRRHVKDTLRAKLTSTHDPQHFDLTSSSSTGISQQSGLFRTYYPTGSVSALSDQGPALDLTLYYSPLRANESALGDGWAFRLQRPAG